MLFSSIIVWLCIPFRQRHSQYFYYFFILAISDPIVYVFRKFGLIHYTIIYLLLGELLLLSLFRKKELSNKMIYFLTCFLTIDLAYVIIPGKYVAVFLLILVHTLIFFRFIYILVMNISLKNVIQMFTVILVLYEITIITKFINILTNFTDAYIYFIITTIFEIFIGLFFIIFREDNPRLLLQLK